MNEIAPAAPRGLAPAAPSRPLIDAVLEGRTAATTRSYAADYRDFARFLSAGRPAPHTPGAALDALILFSAGLAHECVLAYRAHLVARGLSPATIARRLAALRTAVRLARQMGRVGWALEVDAPDPEGYRDTAGPGLDGWRLLLATAESLATTPKGRRDLALLRLMHDLALRRGECCGLDLADLDVARGAVAVKGKGRHHRVRLTLSRAARIALEGWVAERGDWPGPLFVGLPTGRVDALAPRLTGEGVRWMVALLARRAGIPEPVRPHGLRHQAITEALDATGGDVRKVAKFSRHRKVETVMRYDDNRADVGGEIAGLLGDGA